jgi:GH18 family chitinase
MSKTFEIGAYYHKLKEIDVAGIDHATFLESEEVTSESLKDFYQQHPKIKLFCSFEKKGYGRTLRAHCGMDLVKECQTLLKQGDVRVALPADVELLKSFDLRSLAALEMKIDLMAFDYYYPEMGCRTNFHTLLFAWEGPSVVNSLQYLHDEGISSHQINLGLARFGTMFKNVSPGMNSTGYLQPCEGSQLEKPEMSLEDIQNYLKNNPFAKLFYTSLHGCFQSFIYNQENGDWISFDDEKTLKAKKEWARRQKLSGVFFYGLS